MRLAAALKLAAMGPTTAWPGAVATVSNLNAAVNGVETIGNAGDLGGGSYNVESFGFNDLSLLLDFGTVLSFDLNFDGDMFSNAGEYESLLVVSLLGTDYSQLTDGTLFTLSPISAEDPAVAIAIATDRLTTVTDSAAVPEASQWAIFLTGLSLMAWTVRRRQQR